VWAATCAQRCAEHGELVDECALKLDAAPKPGQPSAVPAGAVAVYGPGLAPLEFARLTGLVQRYTAAAGAPPRAQEKALGAQDAATLGGLVPTVSAHVLAGERPPPPEGGAGSAGPPPPGEGARAEAQGSAAAAEGAGAESGAMQARADATPVYPRHLPELRVQKLPKCAPSPGRPAATRRHAAARAS